METLSLGGVHLGQFVLLEWCGVVGHQSPEHQSQARTHSSEWAFILKLFTIKGGGSSWLPLRQLRSGPVPQLQGSGRERNRASRTGG